MIRLFLLIHLVLLSVSLCEELDFYAGLRQDVSAQAQFGTTRQTVILGSPAEIVFLDRVTQSQDKAAADAIQIEGRRIEAMDQAMNLPRHLQESYRKEQKRLEEMQKKYADRIVEGSLLRKGFREQLQIQRSVPPESVSTGSVNPLYLEAVEQGNLNHVAAVVSDKVPDNKKQAYIAAWKASQIEPSARQTFALALAAMQLHGASSLQAQVFDAQLHRIEETYRGQLKSESSVTWTTGERDQFLYMAVRNHRGVLNLSTRRNLDRIQELETMAESAANRSEVQMAMRKIEWEKAFLTKNLERDGLKLADVSLSDVSLTDQAFLNWYQAKHKAGKTMVWPLKEAGRVLGAFHPDHPFMLLQAISTREVVSVCEGTLTVEEQGIRLDCMAAQVVISGAFAPVPGVSGKVKAGQVVASFSQPMAEIEISAFVDGRAVDFQSFF